MKYCKYGSFFIHHKNLLILQILNISTVTLYINLSNAFDAINHDILVMELEDYWNRVVSKWMKAI